MSKQYTATYPNGENSGNTSTIPFPSLPNIEALTNGEVSGKISPMLSPSMPRIETLTISEPSGKSTMPSPTIPETETPKQRTNRKVYKDGDEEKPTKAWAKLSGGFGKAVTEASLEDRELAHEAFKFYRAHANRVKRTW